MGKTIDDYVCFFIINVHDIYTNKLVAGVFVINSNMWGYVLPNVTVIHQTLV